MTPPSPQDIAQRLGDPDGSVRRAAEAELASLPDGLVATRTLQAWDDYPTTRRQRGTWMVAFLAVVVLLPLGLELIHAIAPPADRPMAERVLHTLFTVGFGGIFGKLITQRLLYPPRKLRLLLLRLDDVRLVPLWLASVRAKPTADERAALLEKLAKWLPRWHETQTPLPESARRDLAREMARCCEHGTLSDVAFLTAALVALDSDPARGIPPDATLHGYVVDLTRTPGRVGEAAADALQRLGPPL